MNPHRFKAYWFLLIVAAVWGLAGPIIKFTLRGLPPDVFLCYRLFISSLAGVIIFLIRGLKIPLKRNILINVFAYGFLSSTVTLSLLFLGMNKTTVLDMSLISVFSPLLVSLLGYWFLKEHITKKETTGISIAFTGSLIILLDPLLKIAGSPIFGQLVGNILILISVVTSAVSVIILKKLLRENVSPVDLTNMAFITGFLTLTPFVLLTRGFSPVVEIILHLSLPYHLGVFYMALISGTLAYTLGNKAQKTIEVSEAALFAYLQPLFSAPLAIVWLGEKITLPFIFGAVIIACGVYTAEIKKRS